MTKTLIDLVEDRAAERGDQRLFTFLLDGELAEAHLSYAELRTRSRMIGGELQRLGAAGERALLLYPPGLEYVEAFFGCLYAGVIAVPAYPPNPAALDRTLPRLQAIIADARASIIMTTSPLRAIAASVMSSIPELEHIRWVTTDALDPALAAGWTPPAVGATSLAFLQYTSGSTDMPKGVMVSHANLLHNSALIRDAFGHTTATRGVLWLPPYHDMGLIGGIIQPLFSGFPGMLLSPLHFLQKPLRWLTAITRFRANTSGAPNFAYELCIRKTTPEQRAALDLSSWNLAFNGAEPIRSDTLARFGDVFAPAGFRAEAMYPCYGLAETTLIATGGTRTVPPIVRGFEPRALGHRRAVAVDTGGTALVGCGVALPGGEVVIVDPETRRGCGPGQIGEIWLSGPSVAGGYFRREEETARTFLATRVDTGEGPYLRTGDLGFIDDGELFVVGRCKDLIIIRGHNHYPHDIERTVESTHRALRPGCGAAFSIDEAGEERLVITYEIEPAALRQAEEIIAAVRRAVADAHELSTLAVVLVEQRSIPKTSSGKIQRHACRAAFLAGELEAVAGWRGVAEPGRVQALQGPDQAPAKAQVQIPTPVPPPSPAASASGTVERAVLRWLVDHVQAQTGLPADQIDVHGSLAQFGLSSLQIVSLTGDLETHLGRRLSPTLAYEHPTIALLARHLAGRAPAAIAPVERASRAASVEPIAIVGIGCRFPSADGPDAFWRLLHDGVDAIDAPPADRRQLGAPATSRPGGYLEAIDQFDPELFRLSQREADAMDPQHRLLLEVAWRALEDAGQPIAALAASSTGVFVGISTGDYGRRRRAATDVYSVTGNAPSIAANRLSYAFDLRGPSVAIDTACSSSLVAVHLACQSLRTGESTVALAGGVNLVLSDQLTASLEAAGFLAPDARCKAFDAAANGYVRGEGAGMVVLKPLSRARADGDRVYAVIRGSAVNSDGRSNGLTAPSAQAQHAVLRRAYDDAQVDPSTVEYVEAHGTGTALGDPIEARAIAEVLHRGDHPCRLGSVKTNIGHLEAAAGIAGLIKTALALHHREIPASLHVRTPNPHIAFAELGLAIQTERSGWRGEHPIAGVSSFGFGGTNAHVVLEMPERHDQASQPRADRPSILTLSAHHPDALRALATAYADRRPDAPWEDVCNAAATRRDHREHRLAVVARSADDAIAALRSAPTGHRRNGQAPPLVYVFSGQGSQWPRLAHGLLDEPAFRAAFDDCDRAFAALAGGPGWSLSDELAAAEPASRLRLTAIAQPVVFAVQVALAALWRDWGLEPAAVVGHSLGEIAAAHVAGALSLDDALRVAWHRGQLLEGARGAMAMVELPLAETAALLVRFDRLSIAAENAPLETVVSGDSRQLAALKAELGPAVRELPTGYAFHSAATDPFQQPLADALAGLAPRATTLPMISTLTGTIVDGTAMGAEHWRRQIREPVRFAAAIDRLIETGHDHFLELGVPVLGRSIENLLRRAGRGGVVASALRRGQPDQDAIAGALAMLYTHGQDVAWARRDGEPGPVIALPPMPWVTRRCWLAEDDVVEPVAAGADAHPLLGRPVRLAEHRAWDSQIDVRRLPYLSDHRFEGAPILPATAFLEMALAAASGRGLDDVQLHRPLLVDATTTRTTQVVQSTDSRGRDRFRIFSRGEGDDWKLHATGTLAAPDAGDAPLIDLVAARKRCRETVSLAGYHDSLERRGLSYGPSFRGLVELFRGPGEALARVTLPAALEAERTHYHLHPALLDACAQIVAALDTTGRPFMPVGAARVRLYRTAPATVWSSARLVDQSSARSRFDLVLADEAGAPVAEITGLSIQYLDEPSRRLAPDRWLYDVRWQRQPLRALPRARAAGIWLVFADGGGVADALAHRLGAGGDRCIQVPARTPLDQITRAVDAVRAEPLLGVIDLWGLDARPATSVAELDADHARIIASAISIIQALSSGDPIRLWLVTRGAQPAGAADATPATSAAMLWGLGRTLAQERPDLMGGLIDLAPGASPVLDAAALHRELTASDGEDQVAYRDSRYVARLGRIDERSEAQAEISCRADGTYLITGGLGGLGLVVARSLADRGARRIILLGRSGLPPRAEWSGELPARVAAQVAAVRELEARGVAVHLASVDVGDEAQLSGFLAGFRREAWPPIRGVVHLAGVLHDRTLARLEPALLAEVFRAKVTGAWLLDRLITEPVDFFAVFASMASVLGSAGQASYAAANAFLDALAHDRHRRGLPAIAIDWGPWSEVGFANATGRGDRLSRGGVASIEPEQGVEVLARLLASDRAQVAVMAIDWAQLARSFPSATRAPFLRDVVHADTAGPKPGAGATGRAILAAAPAEREAILVEVLTREIVRAVGAAVSIKPDIALDRLGIDSLMGIELRGRLETELGVAIPIGTLLAGPTIAQLATSLAGQLAAPAMAPAPAAATRARSTITAIQPHGDKPAFFCVHPGALESGCYDALARQLGDDRPFYCVRLAELEASYVLDDPEASRGSVEDLAARCVEAVRDAQPVGPYLLGGWSLGGVLTFEMARQLEAAGERVEVVALFDSPPPGPARITEDDPELVRAFASYLGARQGLVFPAANGAWRGLDLDARLARVLVWAKDTGVLPQVAELAQMRSLLASYTRGLRQSVERLVDYDPQPCAAPIAYFRAGDALAAYDRAFPDSSAWWRNQSSGRLEIIDTPGDHYTMFLPPNVASLAARLDRVLGGTW